MSENDLIGASELMATLPYGRNRGRAASILVERTWQMGEDARLILLIIYPKDQFRIMLLGRLPKRLPKMIWGGPFNGLRRWMSRM